MSMGVPGAKSPSLAPLATFTFSSRTNKQGRQALLTVDIMVQVHRDNAINGVLGFPWLSTYRLELKPVVSDHLPVRS